MNKGIDCFIQSKESKRIRLHFFCWYTLLPWRHEQNLSIHKKINTFIVNSKQMHWFLNHCNLLLLEKHKLHARFKKQTKFAPWFSYSCLSKSTFWHKVTEYLINKPNFSIVFVLVLIYTLKTNYIYTIN